MMRYSIFIQSISYTQQKKVPVFLGSSFAFVAPIVEATRLFGYSGTLFGIIAIGLVYSIMSAIVKWRGSALIDKAFPSGIGGTVIQFGNFSLAGIGLAAVTGIFLNLILPDLSKPVNMKK